MRSLAGGRRVLGNKKTILTDKNRLTCDKKGVLGEKIGAVKGSKNKGFGFMANQSSGAEDKKDRRKRKEKGWR